MLSLRIPVGHLRESRSKEVEDVGGMRRPCEGGVCRNRGDVAGNEVEGQGTEKSKNRLTKLKEFRLYLFGLRFIGGRTSSLSIAWIKAIGVLDERSGRKFGDDGTEIHNFIPLNQEGKGLGIMKEEKNQQVVIVERA